MVGEDLPGMSLHCTESLDCSEVVPRLRCCSSLARFRLFRSGVVHHLLDLGAAVLASYLPPLCRRVPVMLSGLRLPAALQCAAQLLH